jgi:hypothetical protein
MKLKEVFDQLTYGELSQLAIGGSEMGAINAANYDRILAHINLGLTALYKRFQLKEGQLIVELQANRLLYPLNSKFAVSSRTSREPVRYIKDSTAAPFKDDLLKIKRAYGTSGFEFKLNDLSDPFSLMTPTSTSLSIPQDIVVPPIELEDDLRTTTLKIVYQANHPKLVTDDGDLEPELVDLELPDTHLEPLLLFVAARLHTPAGMTNETNMGNTYYAKYEAACVELEMKNLTVDQGSQNDRLSRNGWV